MKLTLDLREIWQDCKESLYYTYLVWTDPKIAPPGIRTYDVGFVTLHDQSQSNVGCFVPELYELAKIGGLKAQQKEKIWNESNNSEDLLLKKKQPFYRELYLDNGTPKTPFELSVLPEIYSDEDKHCIIKIQKKIAQELNYRIKRKQPLPPLVFKYQIESDYLKNLHLIQLTVGNARSLKVNILNPKTKTTLKERMAHYLAQRAALILTILAILPFSMTSSYVFLFSGLGLILGRWCSDEFSTYGLTESLLREFHSDFAKEFRWGEKISLKKTLKTICLLAALGFYTYLAFTGAWANVTHFAIWQAGTPLLIACKYALAAFASTLAAVSTFVSGTAAQRYFWGLGIWDKQIDFSLEKPIKPKQRPNFADKLTRWQQKFEHKLKKRHKAQEFEQSNQEALFQFNKLKEILGIEVEDVKMSSEYRRDSASGYSK